MLCYFETFVFIFFTIGCNDIRVGFSVIWRESYSSSRLINILQLIHYDVDQITLIMNLTNGQILWEGEFDLARALLCVAPVIYRI